MLAIPRPGPPLSARENYLALNAVRVDPARVYYVRDLELRRDTIRFSFTEGKLALLQAVDGRVTGFVFTGEGRALAVPRDAVERRSLGRFLGEPMLDQPFSRALVRFTDDAGEIVSSQLAEAQPVHDAAFVDDWNPLVANLNPGHSVRILADWLSDNPRPYFYAGLMGATSGAFDVIVDRRREEPIMIGQPQWVGGIRHYNTWASFSAASESPCGEPAASPVPFSPLSFVIHTTIHPDNTLEGQTHLRLKALRAGERLVPLQLSRHLAVQSVRLADGPPLDFYQNEELRQDELVQRGNDALFLVLDSAPREGDEILLDFTYRGSVISDAGNGVLFVGDRGAWYPNVSAADRFASFDLTFRWPRRLRLVATGDLVEERAEGDWRIGRWRSSIPFAVAGFNLGEYDSHQVPAGAARVEVFANRQLEQALVERFVRPALSPVQPRTIVTRRGPMPLPPRLALPDAPPPSPAALLKKLGADLADAVLFFEKLNGPFPFSRLSVAQIPGSFGQGWPGLLYLSTFSFLTPEAQRQAGIARRTQEQFTELIPFHEVAHQWWGGIVGWASYRDQWIPEALANYLTLLYADSKNPDGKELAGWLEVFRDDLAARLPDSDERVESAGPLALGYRLRSSKISAAYTQIVYGKGAWVIHMLRTLLRDPTPGAKDPDARFSGWLRALLEKHKFRALTTRDFQRELESRMTPAMDLEGDHTMDWFFEQWVRGTGIPHYKAAFDAKPLAAPKTAASASTPAAAPAVVYQIRGKLMQTGVPETFLASVPVYAARPGGKPVLLGNVVASGGETSFQFTARFAPRKLLIDPHGTLLKLAD